VPVVTHLQHYLLTGLCKGHAKDVHVPTVFAYYTFADGRVRVDTSLTRRRWPRSNDTEDFPDEQHSSSYHLPSYANIATELERFGGVSAGYQPWQQTSGDNSTVVQGGAGPSNGKSS